MMENANDMILFLNCSFLNLLSRKSSLEGFYGREGGQMLFTRLVVKTVFSDEFWVNLSEVKTLLKKCFKLILFTESNFHMSIKKPQKG